MKAAVLIFIVASIVGLVRHRELEALRLREAILLESRSPASSPFHLPLPARDAPSALLSEAPAGLASKVWRSFGPWLRSEKEAMLDPSFREIDASLAQMDHLAVMALVQKLLADHPMDEEQQRSLQYFIVIRRFAIVNPQEAMRLLVALPDSSFLTEHSRSVFRLWTIKRPAEAIHWFDSLEGEERKRIATRDLNFDVMTSQARFDPAGVLDRILNLEASGRADLAGNFGIYAQFAMRGSEHLDFLTALTAAEAHAPDSRVLATIRQEYVKELTNHLGEMPFDEATEILDHGFNPEDRQEIATKLAGFKELTEPARWGEWLTAHGVAAKSANPFVRFSQEWSMGNSPSE